MVPKIKLGLSQMSDGAVEDFGFSIVNAMTNSPDFPKPNPTVAALLAATNAFSSAIAATSSREKVSFMLKNQQRAALEDLIRQMANYVAQSGDPVKIVRAGFTLVANGKGNRELGAANGLKIQVGGDVGVAVIQVGVVKNALSYFVEYSINPVQNDQWVHVVAEKGRLTLSKLISLTAYDFRGGAVGSRGQVVHTGVITKTVL